MTDDHLIDRRSTEVLGAPIELFFFLTSIFAVRLTLSQAGFFVLQKPRGGGGGQHSMQIILQTRNANPPYYRDSTNCVSANVWFSFKEENGVNSYITLIHRVRVMLAHPYSGMDRRAHGFYEASAIWLSVTIVMC